MPAMDTLTPQETKGLQVTIPARVHKALAIESASRDVTMGALVSEALIQYLGISAEDPTA